MKRRGRYEVGVDFRVELMSVVLQLSGYGELYKNRVTCAPSSYLSAVAAWFGLYRADETILFFRKANLRICGDLPFLIALSCAPGPGLEFVAHPGPAFLQRAGGKRGLGRYADNLRAFARRSGFFDFFAQQENAYRLMAASCRPESAIAESIEDLETFFGSEQYSYGLILAPLLQTVAYGLRVVGRTGQKTVYAVLPSAGVRDGLIYFKSLQAAKKTVVHEFTHSFINPLVDANREELRKHSSLFKNIRYRTGANYGDNWLICLYEHLVRAVTTIVLMRDRSEETIQKELLSQEEQGFLYIKPLYRILKEYGAHRADYAKFEEYFPRVIKLFEKLKAGAG